MGVVVIVGRIAAVDKKAVSGKHRGVRRTEMRSPLENICCGRVWPWAVLVIVGAGHWRDRL